MIIEKGKYKDVFALRLSTRLNVATVLPNEGGKIASFIDREGKREYLLQNPSKTFLHLGKDDDYASRECCGFDDMFPTIDQVTVKTESGDELIYPDHGEVARSSYEWEISGQTLILRYNSTSFGYEFVKILSEDGDGKLVVDYKITNKNAFDLDAMWTAHCLINAEKGAIVETAFSDGDPVDVMFDFTKELAPGRRAFTSKHFYSDWGNTPILKKFYFPEKGENGILSYRYKSGDKFVMEFDKDKVPCVGVWINYGFFNQSYCVGFEPSTAGYDTVVNARKYGKNCVIKSKETLEFRIKIYSN